MSRRERRAAGSATAATVASGALSRMANESAMAGGPTHGFHRTQWQVLRRRFWRHKLAVAGAVVLALLSLSAIFAPHLAPYELNPPLDAETLAGARHGPSGQHWFGTDELGRDQLTRVLFAGRISLTVGLAVAVVSTVVGTVVGASAGYFGKWLDQLLMRLTDLFLIVPGLAVLMIAQKGLAGRGAFGGRAGSTALVIVVLSVLFWQTVARVVRGLFLSLKEREFVEAARASGASGLRIIARHILPNCVGAIVVNTTLVIGLAILTESVLSFLGFGVQPPTVSWGSMLAQSKGTVGTPQSYLIYSPGLAILVTVLAVNFVGDGLRDAFDPQAPR
ncbi:MAG: ABC transporter permease [Actinomycetota bacterium]|nr:ABC transporter permease [Actinomycetota bacterium]